MTPAFWDSSAFVKLLVDEVGSDHAERVWNDPAVAVAVASRLAVPEVSAALSAARRDGRLDQASHDTAQREWRSYRSEVDIIELTPGLAEDAAVLAVKRDLSGADAVHLATALTLRDHAVILATWDRRLAMAASAEGLDVMPALP